MAAQKECKFVKFIHLSDLHLGKSVHGFSLLEDQEHILKQILAIADAEKPDAAFVSGDVFDRNVAPTEALRLFEDFLDGFVRRGIKVFVISGNHDSPDRLAFNSRLMKSSGVRIARVFDGRIESFVMSDSFGEVNIFLLPFVKPAWVIRHYPDDKITSCSDAVSVLIKHMGIDKDKRNILLAHQFVLGAVTSESEEISVGGVDNVEAAVFAPFDYVALGHLHRPQSIGGATIRYCGTPLKYSFSEAAHTKTVSVVELLSKGTVQIREVPLYPKRDMREIRGKYSDLLSPVFSERENREDYIHVTLTDEEDQPDAVARLRMVYPNLMRLDYDNRRTRAQSAVTEIADASQYQPIQLFEMFFKELNGQDISPTQRDYLAGLIQQVWEDSQ